MEVILSSGDDQFTPHLAIAGLSLYRVDVYGAKRHALIIRMRRYRIRLMTKSKGMSKVWTYTRRTMLVQ